MHYYQLTKDELFKQLNTNENGLSSQEAAARLLQY
ncbi:hypothetical protein KA405_06625 [Patescibacteria group bacterium]|nr:hypothetical protein [Patescibacteria group bacterium]